VAQKDDVNYIFLFGTSLMLTASIQLAVGN